MSEPRVIRTFTADVIEYVADGFNFTGCTDRNPDYCACGEDSEVTCNVCDEPIEDGQLIQSITYPGNPYFDAYSPDQHWEHEYWHTVCPEDEPAGDGERG